MQIAAIRKNSREEFRISIDEFHGRRLANIRCWFARGDGEFAPGKQGIALQAHHIAGIIEALQAAAAELKGGAA